MKHIRDQELDFIINSGIGVEDPSIDQFSLFIDFNAYSGLFAPESRKNSALAYLKRTGEYQAYELLSRSIKLLQKILDDNAYRLLSIDGIDTLISDGMKRGAITPLNLTFRETIDWEFRQVLIGIMIACYDQTRQINILPDNLRRFSCIIYFRDARALQSTLGFTDYKARYGYDVDNLADRGKGTYDLGLPTLNSSNKPVKEPIHISDTQHIAIQIPICEILIPNLGLTANHLDMQPTDHSIVFNVRRFITSALFFDQNIVDPNEAFAQKLPKSEEEFKAERRRRMKAQLQRALLTKVNSLRDTAIRSALLKYDTLSYDNELLNTLNKYLKPNLLVENLREQGVKNAYKVIMDRIDDERDNFVYNASSDVLAKVQFKPKLT